MRRNIPLALVLFFIILPLPAVLHAAGLELDGSTFLLINPDEESAPSPIENSLGFSLRFTLSNHVSFIPSLDFFTLRYLMRDGVPYPADPEYRDYAVTAFADLSLPFFLEFGLSRTLRAGFGAGPAVIAGYPVRIWDTDAWGEETTRNLISYLYAKGRYLYADSALRAEWKFSERRAVSWVLRGLLPLSRFWDGESRPWYDGFIVQLKIGVLFQL